VFDCPSCGAVGQPDGSITVVQHGADCPQLAAVVRARWPLKDHRSVLPDTGPARPFGRRSRMHGGIVIR
jgi:hypothetical protein